MRVLTHQGRLLHSLVCEHSNPCESPPRYSHLFVNPGEKDHANTRLAQALVGTTRISVEILTV